MKKMTLFFAIALFIFSSSGQAVTPEQFQAHADTVIDHFAMFDPVWGTNIGIHEYDDHLADYSKGNVGHFVKYLEGEEKYFSQIDISGWSFDDHIDFQLLLSNIKFLIFQLKTFPYWRKSPSVYADQCISGIYYLMLRDFASAADKLPSLLGRLNEIPAVCRTARANLTEPVPIFIETSVETIDEGTALIEGVCRTFIDDFPDKAAAISEAQAKALKALKEFNYYLSNIKGKAKGDFAIGEKNLDFLLSDIHLLDINSDSLLSLGNYYYSDVDSQMDALAKILPASDTLAKFPIPSLDKHDVLSYYQWEINQVRDFVRQSGIASVPDNFGDCIPIETPAFLRGTIRGIAYEPPAPLDQLKTGFFYVRPLPDTFNNDQKSKYADYIAKRGFRGSVVHEAFPGHHLQLLLANRHHSKIRRIQQDLVMVEGWALYSEEMAYRQGLFGADLRQWNGVLGGIRFRAVRIIVDIGLQTGRFTPETALAFMNEKLGENPYYYTAEIRRYCANPTQALSYLTGKILITKMRDTALAKEGNAFSLKEFHDRLLSEGSIPPSLIAAKYGW